jgi:hypothetical protein
VELYTGLTAERPDDDRLWVSLLRVQGRRGDGLALQTSLRRLRTALVELGHGDDPTPFYCRQTCSASSTRSRHKHVHRGRVQPTDGSACLLWPT